MITKKGVRKVIWFGILILAFVFFIISVKADIFMGTCEGYIVNESNLSQTISGANVTVTVQGCTTPPENCQRSVLSQSNGYYVIANLNLPPYGNVSGTAIKGSAYGTNTSQADDYQAAFMNISLCDAPSSPSLTPVNDSHYPNITFWFNWSSSNGGTFDQWYWLGSWQTASSPQTKTNLAFANYTWGARTCLDSQPSCCSASVYDNFSVYNSRPCIPILQDQPNTNENTVILNWSSNTTAPCPDADNDTKYYDFRFDSGTIYSNVTPPQAVSNLSLGPHQWEVRECDPWECSGWASDSFSVTNEPCPPPTLNIQNNTCENQVILSWDSADNDSEGDSCHDDFKIGNITQSPASSPQVVTLTEVALYPWGVRSCDDKGACSVWVESSFIYCNCGVVQEIEEGGKKRIYRGGACILPAGYELVVSKPGEIYPGENFKLNVNLKYFQAISNLKVETDTPNGITIEPFTYDYINPNQELSFELKGKTSRELEEGNYTIFIKGYGNNGTLLVNKHIDLQIILPPTTLVRLFRLEWPFSCCSLLFYILLLIFLTVLAWLVRKTYLINQERKAGERKHISKIKEEVKKV
ncbi:MAG: carboxypeptidase-like regulatory domain-containing protein [Candidatus Pacearchaeota archaeon]